MHAQLESQRFLVHSRRASLAAGGIVMLIGALTLVGWLFDIGELKGSIGRITMKANAALSLLLAGCSLALVNIGTNKKIARLIGRGCAVLITLLGILTLSQHILGWNLGIDQLLFTEAYGELATTSPGRMGPVGSSCFVLAGIALLLFYDRRKASAAQILSMVVGLLSLFPILGYTYEAEELYGIARYTGIAFNTAAALFLLSFGLLAARADEGILTSISNARSGGLMGRRLLITAFTVPLILGWVLLYFERAGHYDLGFGTSLLVISTIIIFSIVIWRTSIRMNRSEAAVNVANERFRLAETAVDGFVYEWEIPTGRVERSEGLLKVVGYSPVDAEPTTDWWSSQIHPDDFEAAREVGLSALKSQEGWSNEYRVRHRDGHYVHVLDRGLILRDAAIPARVVGTIVNITERKRSEELLRHRKFELEEIINNTPMMLTRCSRDLRYGFVSRAYAAMIGRTPQEIARRPIVDVMGEEGLKAILPYIDRVLSGERVEYEAPISFQDSPPRWLRVIYIPDRDAKRNVTGWFASIIDISREKQSERDQQLLFDIGEIVRLGTNVDDLLFAVSQAVGEHLETRRCLFNETDLESDRETVHRDYCRGVSSVAGVHKISEYSPITTAEMTSGKTVVNRDSMIDPRTAEYYQQVYAPHGERAYIAVPLMRENRWVATLWASDDRPRDWTQQEVGLLEAVAERSWLAVEKLRSEQKLRESDERMRLALEAGNGGTWDINLETGETFWSPSHFLLLGYDPALSGSADLRMWQRIVHNDDLPAVMTEWNRAEASHDEYRSEHRIRRPDDGEIRWLAAVGRFFYNEEGKAVRFVGVFFDVTERKQVEEERELMLTREQSLRSQAERANRLKDEFLATVSHELRAPLNAVLGWASLLNKGKLDDATFVRAAASIERNARSQAQLVEDLLDVSRIISGKLQLTVRPIALIPIIKAVIDSVRPAADAKRIEIQMSLDGSGDRITADGSRLQQVIWNLLSNAIKFTPERGAVHIILDRAGSNCVITVRDNGEGIDADFLPYVFDRFQQADGTITRTHGGLGLGLAIVRHLVEMHGGTVKVESDGLGCGASFIVTIPARSVITIPSLVPPLTKDAQRRTVTGEPANLGGLRILAVDDDLDTRNMVQAVLHHYGAEVRTAGSAREAMDSLLRWKPDLIVSDIGMPEEDGFSLIEKVRRLDPALGGGTLAIALTGFVRVEDRMRALTAGYDLFVSKPVDPAELASAVSSLVEEHKDVRLPQASRNEFRSAGE